MKIRIQYTFEESEKRYLRNKSADIYSELGLDREDAYKETDVEYRSKDARARINTMENYVEISVSEKFMRYILDKLFVILVAFKSFILHLANLFSGIYEFVDDVKEIDYLDDESKIDFDDAIDAALEATKVKKTATAIRNIEVCAETDDEYVLRVENEFVVKINKKNGDVISIGHDDEKATQIDHTEE